MGVADDYAAAVAHLRGWGFDVREEAGCYGRGNGGSWSAGVPVGHGNHHYVCSLNPDQGYIDNLVANLVGGAVVNWFADVHGRAYLIGTGPMNHFGTGNQSVLDRTRNDQPPPGPATSQGSISGNSHYSGTECQHPGDSTPWPQPMLDVMVAINAAEFLVWGYTAARAINHFEWTNRKIDMSAGGGPNSGGWAGDELRRRVDARMSGTPVPPEPPDEGDTMYYNVIRDQGGIDYAYSGPAGVFFRIESPDAYHFLTAAGMIDVPHGEAPVAEQNLMDFIRDECGKRAGERNPAVLAQGDGYQSIDQALAQTRNDVSAIKAKVGA